MARIAAGLAAAGRVAAGRVAGRPGTVWLLASPLVAVFLAVGPLAAQDLPQGAVQLGQTQAEQGQAVIATGRWTAAGGLPALRIDGAVTTTSWQIPAMGLDSLQLMTRLQTDLETQGFRPIYACATADCGGFDFRFAIPVLTEPQMHVDLGDFRYLAVQKPGENGGDHRALLISRGPGLLYLQITTVQPRNAAQIAALAPPLAQNAPLTEGTGPTGGLQDPLPDPLPDTQPDPQLATPQGALLATLIQTGGVALDDLVFAPGAADLVPGDYASLQILGGWLVANPAVTVALVGHTDATGGLAGNLALSKRRADSVRRWLEKQFDLGPDQVVADGVGYLAPRATNTTPEGQAKNRRVEVIITSTR